MDVPAKTEILERSRLANAAFDAVLAKISEADMTAPGAVGAWSVKDVIAHVAADDRWFAGQLEAAAKGEIPTALACYGGEDLPPADLDFNSNEDRNTWHYRRNRDLSLSAALEMAAEARARRDSAIEALPDGELAALYTIGGNGHVAHLRRATEGEQGWPLWRALAGNCCDHYDDHTKDLEAFLAANTR